MSERISKATFTTLANRPPAAHFGIGKCTILDTGVTYESDGIEWVSNKNNALTWATKPTASSFGIGQAWFSDIGAMGYSDGAQWSILATPNHLRAYVNLMEFIPYEHHSNIEAGMSTYDCSAAFNSAIAAAKMVLVPNKYGTSKYYARGIVVANYTTLVGQNFPVIMSPDGSGDNQSVISIAGVHHVEITGLLIDGNYDNTTGNDQNGCALCSVSNSNNINIHHNIFQNNRYITTNIAGSNTVRFSNNRVYNTDLACMPGQSSTPTYDIIISDNLIDGGTSEGIDVFPTAVAAYADIIVKNISITNNIIRNKNSSGIAVNYAKDIIIAGNIIESCLNGIFSKFTDGCLIDSNICRSPTYDGVELQYQNNGRVSNNILSGCRGGVTSSNCTNLIIDSNSISNGQSGQVNFGCILDNSTNVGTVITGNNMFDTKGTSTTESGIVTHSQYAIIKGNSFKNIKFADKSIWAATGLNSKIIGNHYLGNSDIQYITSPSSTNSSLLTSISLPTASVAIKPNGDGSTKFIIYNNPITANAAVTATQLGSILSGVVVRVVRTAACTGAFNVDVFGSTTLTAAGQWCELIYYGTGWVVTAKGTL